MSMTTSRRVLSRLLTLLVALAGVGTVTVVTAPPALANDCPQGARVYIITNAGVFSKTPADPINGPTFDFFVDVTGAGSTSFELGGVGLKHDEDPFWDFYDLFDGSFEGTFIGTRTNDNCVSNQRSFTITGNEGAGLIFRATYEDHDTGAATSQQAHFRIFFV